jgi:hypothetical protein
MAPPVSNLYRFSISEPRVVLLARKAELKSKGPSAYGHTPLQFVPNDTETQKFPLTKIPIKKVRRT